MEAEENQPAALEPQHEERHERAPVARQPGRISRFLSSAVRVLRLAKKPDKDEFWFIAKVTGLGILVIGFVGFLIESARWIITGGI